MCEPILEVTILCLSHWAIVG